MNSCLHCFSSASTVFDIDNEVFLHESQSIRFVDCYSFVTGKQACGGLKICQMCMHQLKSAYIFKRKYQPSQPLTIRTNEDSVKSNKLLQIPIAAKVEIKAPVVPLPEDVPAGAGKIKSDEPVLEHPCSLCNKLFGSTANLNRHIKSFHSGK
jgi:hypothetical protein